ncbi:MAG: beta-ketoacyl-ACP synthase III [Chthoniobacterales bacterium]
MKKSPTSRQPGSIRTVSIVGTGSYLPERVMTNADLEKIVDTSDDWITSRTGISERRIADENETTSTMAAKAGAAALEQAGIQADEVDLILVATVTPDTFFPSTACWVQKHLGASRAACFDISAACSGFLYGIEIAQQFISNHTYETVLVIGADKLSSLLDWSDRNTCVLFGDGAGAAVLRHRGGSHGVITTYMASDGNFGETLVVPGGGCAVPITQDNVDQKLNTIKMKGRETFKKAVNSMLEASHQALEKSGLTKDDISCFIPHQANLRIIEAIAERLEVPMERFHINLDKYGNTSAAAVAIALDEAARKGRFEVGDYILLVVFGGGFTWASSVIQW